MQWSARPLRFAPMVKWWKTRWKRYVEAADPTVLMSGSQPITTAVGVLILSVIFLACQYVPFIHDKSGFDSAWVSVGLAACGGTLTYVGFRHGCRGPIGAVASLLDNTLYFTAIAFAAVSMKGSPAIAMAAFYGVAIIGFTGQLFAFSFVLAVTMVTPTALLLVAYRPPIAVTFILVTSLVGMLLFSNFTGYRRAAARTQQQLEQALHAANDVADESIQAALTTTLLTLGHFLHELRNYQTAVSSNLEYISINATLSAAARGALDEARLAQGKQERLVRSTVDDLRARSSPTNETFVLSVALSRAVSHATDARVIVKPIDFDVDIAGNPEHLSVVLLNLVRNAEQAGANMIYIDAQPEPSGHAVQIVVEDDGPGIEVASRGHLFDSFAVSTKPGGSGLGLYLVSRYTQLLGGQVESLPNRKRGAAFSIRLPGHVRTVAAASRT